MGSTQIVATSCEGCCGWDGFDVVSMAYPVLCSGLETIWQMLDK